jgi:cytochrome c-type biogenesis protein CcmH/NrfF
MTAPNPDRMPVAALQPGRKSRSQWTRSWLALVGAAVLVFAGVVHAGQTDAEHARRAHALSSKLMSPFCPGSTLATCTSPQAAKWRTDIQKWVQEGVSEEEIRRRLSARAPGHDLTGTATTAWGWGLPIALAVGAVVLLVWLLRRFRPPPPATTPASKEKDTDDPSLDEKLDRELDRLDE